MNPIRFISEVFVSAFGRFDSSNPETIMTEMQEILNEWEPDLDNKSNLPNLTKRSLEAVTHLTEYEDQKASRILTAIALVSALVGVMYSVCVPKGSEGQILIYSAEYTFFCNTLVILFHVLFGLYCFTVIFGAYIIIRAIMPRFKIPSETGNQQMSSMIFAPLIAGLKPAEWAKKFTEKDFSKLQKQYVRNDVLEAYLIAAKIKDKLRVLQVGIKMIYSGVLVLCIWIVITAMMLYNVETSKVSFGDNKVVIVTDADNTLWDTDSVYASAQINLLKRIQETLGLTRMETPLAFVRHIDQEIAVDHESGLRYPPQLLVNGIVKELIKDGHIDPNSQVLKNNNGIDVEIEAVRFAQDISRSTPPLRPGVRVGLEGLCKIGAMVIIATEGDEKRCLAYLNHYGLIGFVERVITCTKSIKFYRDLANEHHKDSLSLYCIGDQLDRDIEFSKKAGFETIYFPGGFNPKWTPNKSQVQPDYTVSSFSEIPSIITKGQQY